MDNEAETHETFDDLDRETQIHREMLLDLTSDLLAADVFDVVHEGDEKEAWLNIKLAITRLINERNEAARTVADMVAQIKDKRFGYVQCGDGYIRDEEVWARAVSISTELELREPVSIGQRWGEYYKKAADVTGACGVAVSAARHAYAEAANVTDVPDKAMIAALIAAKTATESIVSPNYLYEVKEGESRSMFTFQNPQPQSDSEAEAALINVMASDRHTANDHAEFRIVCVTTSQRYGPFRDKHEQ